MAQTNTMGNIGGFVGTSLLGAIKDATGSYALGLMPIAALSTAGLVAVLTLGRGARPTAPKVVVVTQDRLPPTPRLTSH